jgi:hypothetical protein
MTEARRGVAGDGTASIEDFGPDSQLRQEDFLNIAIL